MHSHPLVNPAALGQSFWADSVPPLPPSPRLEQEIDVDVVVVGGGYTGLCCALKLAGAGRSVALLEADEFGQGASGLNGGQAAAAPRQAPDLLVRQLGRSGAYAYWQLHRRAQRALQQLVRTRQIDCDWRPGILQLARGGRQASRLQRRCEQMQEEYGCRHYRYLKPEQLGELIDSPLFSGALLDGESAHLHPLKLLRGLQHAAVAAGAQLFCHSRVDRIEPCTDRFVLHCNGQRLQADRVVLACNVDQGPLAPKLRRSSWPLYSFMLATEPLPEAQIETLLGRDLAAFDSAHLVHYWKRSRDNRLLFGGADSSAFDGAAFERLRQELQQVYPQLGGCAISHLWGARFALTANRLPQIGQLQPGLFYAQGYNGDGLTLGCYAGLQIAAALLGEHSDFEQLQQLPKPRWPLSAGLAPGVLRPALALARLFDR